MSEPAQVQNKEFIRGFAKSDDCVCAPLRRAREAPNRLSA
jgi:hypothetical protein